VSRTDDTIEDRVHARGLEYRGSMNMLRRFGVTVTGDVMWQLVGVILLDQTTKETPSAEVFSGIGFYSRPAPGANAEAITAAVGGAENQVIVATRDEDLRRRMAKLDQDETAIYNTKATVVIKKTGIVEIRLGAGVAESTIKGQTYRAAEDVFLTALGVFATAIGALNPLTSAAAATALNTAITTFKSAAASYLTTVAKVQ